MQLKEETQQQQLDRHNSECLERISKPTSQTQNLTRNKSTALQNIFKTQDPQKAQLNSLALAINLQEIVVKLLIFKLSKDKLLRKRPRVDQLHRNSTITNLVHKVILMNR